MGAPHRFVQGGNLVIKLITPLVKATQAARQSVGQKCTVDLRAACGPCGGGHLLELMQQTTGISVRSLHQIARGLLLKGQVTQVGYSAVEQPTQVGVFQRLEHMDLRARARRN